MGRKKDAIPSEIIHFHGNRKRGISAREDKTFAWLDQIPPGQRFGFVWELLTAALNGELGPIMQTAVEESDIDRARMAANEMATAFVVDDE
jgi:hypothetical protein